MAAFPWLLTAPRLERRAEDVRRQVNPGRIELLDKFGADPGGPQLALDLALDHRGLLEDEDVLHHDDVALHPLDLGDGDDLARAILEPVLVNDQVNRRWDLLADRLERQGHAGHEDHRPAARGACAPG